jgi:urease subunit gamma/beta
VSRQTGRHDLLMRLTPSERDRLLIFQAAELARRRRARGVLLNVPEATALIADAVIEAARDGARLADALMAGATAVHGDQVLPGVADVVTEVWVEAVFDDGTRLVVVRDPIAHDPSGVGEVLVNPDTTEEVADVVEISVTNTGDVPISVTSHFHFFEANPRLRFNRAAGYGRHLAIAAGANVRFDPGIATDVQLTPYRGQRVVIGFAGLVDGPLDEPGALEAALGLARERGYLDTGGDA